MANCTTCDDMGAVELPESPFPCPDCRPAEYLAELVDCGLAHLTSSPAAERAARKVLEGAPNPTPDLAYRGRAIDAAARAIHEAKLRMHPWEKLFPGEKEEYRKMAAAAMKAYWIAKASEVWGSEEGDR